MKFRCQVFCLSISKIFVPWIEQCHAGSSFLGFALGCSLALQLRWGVMLWEGPGAAAPQGGWGWKGLCRSSGSAFLLQGGLTSKPAHFAQEFVQSHLDSLQGCRLHNISGQSTLSLNHLHGKIFFPYIQQEFPLLQLVTGASCPSLCAWSDTYLPSLTIHEIHFLRFPYPQTERKYSIWDTRNFTQKYYRNIIC